MDFTSSIYIAAFFATRVIEGDFPDIGALYLISKTEIENELHVAEVKTVDIHENFERIHRQKGVFLSTEYLYLINQRGFLDRWLFYHTKEGINFEFEPFKITQEWLFPELNPYPR